MRRISALILTVLISACSTIVPLGDSVNGFVEEHKFPITTQKAVELSKEKVEEKYSKIQQEPGCCENILFRIWVTRIGKYYYVAKFISPGKTKEEIIANSVKVSATDGTVY